MDITQLFNGVAIVVDDELENKAATISPLIEKIEENYIPYVKYTELPDIETIRHFESISFLLLDWILISPEDVNDGVKIPDELRKAGIKENIEFLKKLRETCFAPVFIFTDEETEKVKKVLKDNGLYHDDKPNTFFVESKRELIDGDMFKLIESWIKKTPSVYVLKEWEQKYHGAKNQLFLQFHELSPSWPQVLWENFEADGVNKSNALGQIINRNLHTRMSTFEFDQELLKIKGKDKPNRDELRKVFAGERFVNKERLDDDTIVAGDVFDLSGKKRNLYLNIRPDCDCIPSRSGTDSSDDNVELYLLKGSPLTDKQERDKLDPKYSQFNEGDAQAIVFSMFKLKTYSFQFKNITLENWKDIKEKRIGRLLPPYITRVQQRYTLYLQRQRIPRIPPLAVSDTASK